MRKRVRRVSSSFRMRGPEVPGRASAGRILGIVTVLAIAALAWAVYGLYRARWIDPGATRFANVELRLIPLSGGASDSAIVFVHGLDGDPVDTFKADGVP